MKVIECDERVEFVSDVAAVKPVYNDEVYDKKDGTYEIEYEVGKFNGDKGDTPIVIDLKCNINENGDVNIEMPDGNVAWIVNGDPHEDIGVEAPKELIEECQNRASAVMENIKAEIIMNEQTNDEYDEPDL